MSHRLFAPDDVDPDEWPILEIRLNEDGSFDVYVEEERMPVTGFERDPITGVEIFHWEVDAE